MSYLLSLLLSVSLAHAGSFGDWWYSFCERHLIAHDPYQFEQYPRELLNRERDHYLIKVRWGTATRDDKALLQIIHDEINRRERWGDR